MTCDNCGSKVSYFDYSCHNCGVLLNSSTKFKNIEISKADYFSNLISTLRKSDDKNTIFLHSDGKYSSNKLEKKIYKKSYVNLIIVFLVIFAIVLGLGFKSVFFPSSKNKRTIMIYMIGSDLESKYLAATRDIDEIVNSSKKYDGVDILIYTGGTKNWHYDSIPNDKQALFSVNDGELKKIEEFNSSSMLDYNNLTYLLNYGYENYDSEYYDLILWDHGAGPIYGYGYDEYNRKDSMSLIDIKQALDKSHFNGANKLELIGFDACLMSSVEVAYVLSDYSNYMIASQEFEPGTGWDYSFLSNVNSKTSSLDLGNYIINSYYKYYSSKNYVNGVSLSFLRLNKIDNVEKYLNELFKVLDNDLAIDFSMISRMRSSSKSFGNLNENEYYYDLVDLYDLIDKLPQKYSKEVDNLRDSLNDLVLYELTDLDNTNGVSIYFPYDNKDEMSENINKYGKLSFAASYNNFINNFSNKLNEQKTSVWDLSDSNIESLKDGVVSINLNDEIVNNYSSISYIIFERYEDNTFMPIFNGKDVKIDGNIVSTDVTNKALIAKDKNNNEMYLTSVQMVQGKNFVKYYIPGTLSKWDSNTFDFEMVGVYLEFVIDDDHPNGYVASIVPIEINDNYTYSEVEYDLNDWDSLTLNNYSYIIFDENNNYISDWHGSSIVKSIEFSKGDDINISFTNLDVTKSYYCMFRVFDNQNNAFMSPFVEIIH